MHSATSKQASPFKLFYLERNKLWNMWKYYPVDILIMQIPYTNIFYLRYLFMFFNRLSGKGVNKDNEPILNYSLFSVVNAIMRAKLSAYAKLPQMFLKRRKLKL